jgi:Protein of unknown function (DUF2630)
MRCWYSRKDGSMRAIAIEGFGGTERLKLVDLPAAEPGPDDVLVRVWAAGVGPWDTLSRQARGKNNGWKIARSWAASTRWLTNEMVDEEHGRLRQLEVNLDRCWDLLRQRRALREAAYDPGEAKVKDEKTVEGYLQ